MNDGMIEASHEEAREAAGTPWRELEVTNCDNERVGNLSGFIGTGFRVDFIVVRDGKIAEWPDFFIAAPGEEPDWDTPRGAVDWTGFVEALEAARGASND